jgi:hypothetical protein
MHYFLKVKQQIESGAQQGKQNPGIRGFSNRPQFESADDDDDDVINSFGSPVVEFGDQVSIL